MKLEQLINFVSIAETGSLSESSKLLFLSQPALSHSITALEKSLNIQLFYRSNKGMILTDDGMALLPYAKDICSSVNAFYQCVMNSETCDKLFLVSFPAFSSAVLLDIIIGLKKRAPDLNINLKDSLLRQIPEQIRKFPGSIGFIGFADSAKAKYEALFQSYEIDCELLYSDTLFCYMHKEHPLASEREISISMYQSHLHADLSGASNDDINDNYIYQLASSIKDQKRHCMGVSTLSGVKKLVSENIAIALGPHIAWKKDLETENICCKPLAGLDSSFHYYLLYNRHHFFTEYEKLIIQEVKSFFNQC